MHYRPIQNGQRMAGIDISTPIGSEWRLLGVGDLIGTAPPNAPATAERPDHRCGPAFGDASCGPGRCCSTSSWCGSGGEPHCGPQRGFGGRYDGR